MHRLQVEPWSWSGLVALLPLLGKGISKHAIRTQILGSPAGPQRLKILKDSPDLTRELQDSRLTSQIRLKTQDSCQGSNPREQGRRVQIRTM